MKSLQISHKSYLCGGTGIFRISAEVGFFRLAFGACVLRLPSIPVASSICIWSSPPVVLMVRFLPALADFCWRPVGGKNASVSMFTLFSTSIFSTIFRSPQRFRCFQKILNVSNGETRVWSNTINPDERNNTVCG